MTATVNIAAFAAFHFCIGRIIRSNAEFKPVCRLPQLDVWRYGRQKRQETARNGNEVARFAAKTARFGAGAATSMPPRERLQAGTCGLFAAAYAVVQVRAMAGGATMMELIYHKQGEVSRAVV